MDAVQSVAETLAHKNCKHCAKYPQHAEATWTMIIGLALLLEAEGLRRKNYHHTLSHSTRAVFRTENATGKTVFTVAWTALFAWFLRHVLIGGEK